MVGDSTLLQRVGSSITEQPREPEEDEPFLPPPAVQLPVAELRLWGDSSETLFHTQAMTGGATETGGDALGWVTFLVPSAAIIYMVHLALLRGW